MQVKGVSTVSILLIQKQNKTDPKGEQTKSKGGGG